MFWLREKALEARGVPFAVANNGLCTGALHPKPSRQVEVDSILEKHIIRPCALFLLLHSCFVVLHFQGPGAEDLY